MSAVPKRGYTDCCKQQLANFIRFRQSCTHSQIISSLGWRSGYGNTGLTPRMSDPVIAEIIADLQTEGLIRVKRRVPLEYEWIGGEA